jgi:preprotein translocase subunit SecD
MSTEDPAPGYPPVAPSELGYVPEGYLPPPRRRLPRRWLWLTLGVVAIVVLAAGTTAAVLLLGRWDGRPATGDTAITVQASGPDGGRPSATALDQTKKIQLSRLTTAKLTRPTVTAIGTDTLLITVARDDAEQAKALLVPGNLTFRTVLANVPDQPGSGNPGCRPDQGDRPTRAAALSSARARLGSAYDLAGQIQDPLKADAQALTAFTTLTCAEVTALPARMQYMVPTLTCAMLNGRAPGALDSTDETVAACDQRSTTKYQLDMAKVVGADLAKVETTFDQQNSYWAVNLHFTSAGQTKWTALTKEAVDAKLKSGNGQQVAITVDNQVVSAPEIEQVIPGDAEISGANMDKQAVTLLAANLGHGVLPLRLVIASIDAVG